ncbi:MAG TPA: helix-turn-helix domain-containing protein [Candidatus Saccharimonadales bacterium]|nr:helix-turn-helix domain-containing protein [Candidatus Saccharimonadales bacterium]
MVTDTSAIRNYFARLGLATEVADVYLALHANGPQTISELSRTSNVERTRIYRLIDTLLSSSLIEVESHYKHGVIKAAPIANLHILLAQKEQELKSLQDELGLIEQVLARNSLSSPATRVQFYHGPAGTKQMFWNETRSKTEVLSVLYQNMQIKTNSTFFERWVALCNERNLTFRSIISDTFIASQEAWYNAHKNERLQNWEGRYVTAGVFPITHSMVIYDNVVAYYNWKDNEVFGIEIYNQDIGDAQRILFETIWAKSQPETRA